ncbi:MAG: signal peptidase I [Candidatus Aminicenantes bacterium]|nr:MAG: signal peptidase I [Candidatus Aminicenantes bacterium]
MKEEKKKREQGVFREYFELIAETAVFVFFVMTFVVQAFQIPTGSMEPTLLIGDFLLVNKLAYTQSSSFLDEKILPRKKIERGDIVVFKFPRDLYKDYVKRVIALEGEKVEIKNNQVYVNDQPIPEEYKVHLHNQDYSGSENYNYENVIRGRYGPIVVPPGHCFVMGDNRDNSSDSREWGTLPLNNIKGRPWLVYFSYRAEPGSHEKTSLRERLKKIARFIPEARWKRILTMVK